MDISRIKQDFPIFGEHPDLVYLDSAATSLKPQVVLDKEAEYYTHYSANVHRGIYKLAEKATAEYEASREAVASFINASSSEEVIFTKGTTEGINLVASSFGEQNISSGDSIVGTIMDHHSNFVPWQQLALRKQTTWQVIDVTENGELDLAQLAKHITQKTKIFAFTAVSNTLGTINPVEEIIQQVRSISPDIIIVVDAAQAALHLSIDVKDWDADFISFSAHKMLGPTGVGILWGKKKHLETMSPYQFGGEMVLDVATDKTTFKETPHKFEAGTPNIAGVIALKSAITYLKEIGFDAIHEHELHLRKYAIEKLSAAFVENITILGGTTSQNRCGILSFTLKNYHAHDIAQILDESNIAVRAGHHCTMPLHKKLGIASSCRASFTLYNTEADVEALVQGLQKVAEMLK